MTWQEYKKKWMSQNTCRFCQGSRMHTCTSFRCRPAYEKAERYFEDVVAKEEAEKMGRKYATNITGCLAKERRKHITGAWIITDHEKSEYVVRFRDDVPEMVQAAIMEQIREALTRIAAEETQWKGMDTEVCRKAGRTQVRAWRKEDERLIRNGIPIKESNAAVQEDTA